MATTLLAKLVSTLTSQRENAATEALAFVINRHAAARVAFGGLLSAGGSVPVVVGHVATQHVAGDESRPDLAIYGADGALIGFIEAKFWAGLTDAQPVGYLERLRERGGGLLTFVAPERRVAGLRHEIAERCRGAALPCEDLHGGWQVAGSRVGFLSWGSILSSLRDACSRASDGAGVSDITQLEGLCTVFESEGYIPMSRADLSDREGARQVVMLGQLVPRIVEAAVRDGVVITKGTRPSHGPHSTGRYLTLPHAGVWLGVSYDRWLELGHGPLWLAFESSSWGRADEVGRALAGWIRADPPRAFETSERRVLVPIHVLPGAEESAVIRSAVAEVQAVSDALRGAGMSLLAGVNGPAAPDAADDVPA